MDRAGHARDHAGQQPSGIEHWESLVRGATRTGGEPLAHAFQCFIGTQCDYFTRGYIAYQNVGEVVGRVLKEIRLRSIGLAAMHQG